MLEQSKLRLRNDNTYTGKCGENLTYIYHSNNCLLEIFGDGYMTNFDQNNTPWQDFISNIKIINISKNVLSIGSYSFHESKQLISIFFNSNITKIESNAFYGCNSIKSIDLPYNLESIGSYAFANCIQLNSIILNGDLRYIGEETFANCNNIDSIFFMGNLSPSISNDAFSKTLYLNVKVPTDYQDAAFGNFPVNKEIENSEICGPNVYNFNIQTTLYIYGNGIPIIDGIRKYTNNITKLIFREGITAVPKRFCLNFYKLESVIFSSTISMIDSESFRRCYRLSGSIDLTYVDKIHAYSFYETNISTIYYNQSDKDIYCYNSFPNRIIAYVPYNYTNKYFCDLNIIYNNDGPPIPIYTPIPFPNYTQEINFSTNPKVFKRLEEEILINISISNDNETLYNEYITQQLDLYSNNSNSYIILILANCYELNFNLPLKRNQFIKVNDGTKIRWLNGNLNLIIPDSGKVYIDTNFKYVNMIAKGNGQLYLYNLHDNSQKFEFQLNGSLQLIVPNYMNNLHIDNVEFESSGLISAHSFNLKKKYLNIDDIIIGFNSSVELESVEINSSLTVFQTSKVYFNNSRFDNASFCYQIFNYEINKSVLFDPFIEFNMDPPRIIYLHKISNKNDVFPVPDAEYTIFSGLIEKEKCQKIIEKINFANSGFSLSKCVSDNDEKYANKIIIKYLVDAPEQKKSKFDKYDLIGIIIGVVSGFLLIVIIISLIIRAKTIGLNSTDEYSI